MAHVGEFAFVLLSQAVQADIVPLQVRVGPPPPPLLR